MQAEKNSLAQQRIDKMRSLLAHMHGKVLTLREVAGQLDFSLSGARKYLRFLIDEQVVQVAEPGARAGVANCVALYQLVPVPQAAELLLLRLEVQQAGNSGRRLARLGRVARSGVLVARRSVELPRVAIDVKIARDPLVAALFGKPANEREPSPGL